MEYTVYVHKNLKNEKYYVGCTKLNPSYRWNNGKGYKYNTQMWNDIQNSDWNKDWVHGILGKFEDKQDALAYEAFLIAMLDTIENGYNTSSYSGGTYKRSDKTKKKMSESMTGHEVSEETKKKISESMNGRVLTEEHRKKISESMTGRVFTEESKKKMSEAHGVNGILQFSKDGEFISEYQSTMDAERQTGCHHQHICKCCKGKLKSTGGYIWMYAS